MLDLEIEMPLFLQKAGPFSSIINDFNFFSFLNFLKFLSIIENHQLYKASSLYDWRKTELIASLVFYLLVRHNMF